MFLVAFQLHLNGDLCVFKKKKSGNEHMCMGLKSPRSKGGDFSPWFFLMCHFFEPVAHDTEHRDPQMFD